MIHTSMCESLCHLSVSPLRTSRAFRFILSHLMFYVRTLSLLMFLSLQGARLLIVCTAAIYWYFIRALVHILYESIGTFKLNILC
jgi:hypothetical protein